MITQLLISSEKKPIITASYVIVGGGGGAYVNGTNGLGGAVIYGDTTIPGGSYSITIGAGGGREGLGSSSSFMNLIANGSSRSTTETVNGQTFSGVGGGLPGSGALSSSIFTYWAPYCTGASGGTQFRCTIRGGVWTPGHYSGGGGNGGVVILTIPTIYSSRIVASGAVVTTSGSNTIYRFNYSQSLVAS